MTMAAQTFPDLPLRLTRPCLLHARNPPTPPILRSPSLLVCSPGVRLSSHWQPVVGARRPRVAPSPFPPMATPTPCCHQGHPCKCPNRPSNGLGTAGREIACHDTVPRISRLIDTATVVASRRRLRAPTHEYRVIPYWPPSLPHGRHAMSLACNPTGPTPQPMAGDAVGTQICPRVLWQLASGKEQDRVCRIVSVDGWFLWP